MFQNKSIQFAFLTVWLIGLGACVPPHVPVIDVSKISDSDRIAAANIRVFSFGQQPPKIKKVIGQIKSFSCKHLTWDPPASQGDALEQLQIQAVNAGANALINVTFDTRGTDTWGTNCWQSVQASGVAVLVDD